MYKGCNIENYWSSQKKFGFIQYARFVNDLGDSDGDHEIDMEERKRKRREK